MSTFDDLNDENFVMYAIKAYEKPQCIMSEFETDIKRIKYLKRLFRRYKATGKIKERLILNHLIILYNVFGNSATRILFLKIEKEYHDVLKTFLLFLSRMPDVVYGINGKNIESESITSDMNLTILLRKI